MMKRSTIGTNPLDEIISNPLGAAIPDQHTGSGSSALQEGGKQKNGNRPAGPHSVADHLYDDQKQRTQLHAVSQKNGSQRKSRNSQEGPVPAAHVTSEGLPATGPLSERLVELEEENLCLKWALGIILTPLVLLALLG
ncbi:MAG: hypothetical protein NPIRA03_19710 [Nitrospirales bacterium]|nr:MAG: hypothetical protein NPIRA03_19710 [Nitrospirales bacterium]